MLRIFAPELLDAVKHGGVANTGDVRNWTGHPLSAANWYAFGRLAWDHTLSSAAIADVKTAAAPRADSLSPTISITSALPPISCKPCACPTAPSK